MLNARTRRRTTEQVKMGDENEEADMMRRGFGGGRKYRVVIVQLPRHVADLLV